MYDNDAQSVLPAAAGWEPADRRRVPFEGDLAPPASGPLPADDANAAADAAGGEMPSRSEDADRRFRERIVRRFQAWLDEVLSDEAPPEGLDAEILAELQSAQPADPDAPAQAPEDLGSLWSAMTALAQETKLQGRTFKQLHESLEALPASVRGVVSAHGEALAAVRDAACHMDDLREEQVRRAAETARQETEGKLVNVLLDVRDRLTRGADAAGRLLAAAGAESPNWLGRLLRPGRGPARAAAAAEALLDGCTLSLARLEEALGAIGVSESPCQGQPFDPERMTAAAVERTADVPEGTVVEVYRAGYQWHGRVHRLAEVKVARRPASGGPDEAREDSDGRERT
jgi:molecular chaperone GrpE